MKTFQERLQAVRHDGNLRVADLARWFDRRQSTIDGWLKGSSVTGPPRDVTQVVERVAMLEMAIKLREIPLPVMPTPRRLAFLEKLKGRMIRRGA